MKSLMFIFFKELMTPKGWLPGFVCQILNIFWGKQACLGAASLKGWCVMCH